MKWCRILLVLVTLPALAIPASAGVIFGKKGTKPNSADRVSELIVAVKTEKDEDKREAAAAELRQFDPKANADIVPILIDVLLNDASSSVRAEAVHSLSKLRPVSQQVGWALEQAMNNDKSMRVRLQARTAIWGYHLAGYRGAKDEGPVMQSKEPPLAATPAPAPRPLPAQVVPSAAPRPMPSPMVPASAPRPLPAGAPRTSGPDLIPR